MAARGGRRSTRRWSTGQKSSDDTPVRRALKRKSPLRPAVADGIGAVEKSHRKYLAQDIRGAFGDSLDIDKALRAGREQEHRWDYLLGHTASDAIVAVEPHSAKQDEITRVIDKRKAAKRQLAEHLESNARIAKWLWVASGRVHFANTEKARLRLDQSGIEFVGTEVLAKHLPAPKARGAK